MGTKILIAVLLVLLAWAGWFGVAGGWKLESDVTMSGHGYAAMAVGIVFSLIVGMSLMALVFYSSRKGYDEAASRPQKHGSARPQGGGYQKYYHHYKS
jgi:hypothetical protein